MSWITASRSGRRTGPKLNNGPAQTRAEGSKPHVSTPRNRRGADTHHTNSSNPVASAGRQSHTCGTRNTNASNGVFNQISGNQCFGGVPIHLMVNPPAPSPQNRQASHSDRSAERCPKLLVEKRRLQEEVSALMDKRGWDEERRLRKEISGLRTMRQSLSTASESSWDDDGGSTDGGSTDGGKKKCRKRGDGGKKKSRKRGRSGRRGSY